MRWDHAAEIRRHYGYRDFHEGSEAAALSRWLANRAWVSAERPSVLFDLATARLVERKVLLPGVTVLARLVAQVRDQAASRLWRTLARTLKPRQAARLETLLVADESSRQSPLERLRRAPTRVSVAGMVEALERLQEIRALGVSHIDLSTVPPVRVQALARYAAAGTGASHRPDAPAPPSRDPPGLRQGPGDRGARRRRGPARPVDHRDARPRRACRAAAPPPHAQGPGQRRAAAPRGMPRPARPGMCRPSRPRYRFRPRPPGPAHPGRGPGRRPGRAARRPLLRGPADPLQPGASLPARAPGGGRVRGDRRGPPRDRGVRLPQGHRGAEAARHESGSPGPPDPGLGAGRDRSGGPGRPPALHVLRPGTAPGRPPTPRPVRARQPPLGRPARQAPARAGLGEGAVARLPDPGTVAHGGPGTGEPRQAARRSLPADREQPADQLRRDDRAGRPPRRPETHAAGQAGRARQPGRSPRGRDRAAAPRGPDRGPPGGPGLDQLRHANSATSARPTPGSPTST